MPHIKVKPDNLNERNREFTQTPLKTPVFLNSVPKSGTHLMRNIMRMFVPVEQQYHDTFIQIPVLRQHLEAFYPHAPRLSWGHLLFSDDAAIVLRKVNHVLLVRDPYDWVLARARFFLSDNFEANLEHLKGGNADTLDVLNMMIFGIHNKVPSMREIYTHNAASWLGSSAHLVRYEDLVTHVKALDTPEAEAFFSKLFAKCGMAMPADWRERVRIGSDRKMSSTARENLTTRDEVPDELPETQKQLVDYYVPGLRALLGYA